MMTDPGWATIPTSPWLIGVLTILITMLINNDHYNARESSHGAQEVLHTRGRGDPQHLQGLLGVNLGSGLRLD